LSILPRLQILDGHRIVPTDRTKKLKRLRTREGEGVEEEGAAPKRIRDIKEKDGHQR
jgi:hypothetical protein